MAWLAVPVVILGLAGLLALVAAWVPGGAISPRRQRQIDLGVLIAVIAGLGLWSYFQVYTAPDYGTDEIAFDQYAAHWRCTASTRTCIPWRPPSRCSTSRRTATRSC